VRLGVGAQTDLYDFGLAILGIVAGVITGAIAVAIVGPGPSAVIGGVVAALANVAIRHKWPSPKARADRQAMADLRRQIDAFGSPGRLIDDAKRLQTLQRYGPLWRR